MVISAMAARTRWYSIARLRERADARFFEDDESDLWEGLKQTFYEALLDYRPQVTIEGERSRFELVAGSERKSTGSYYTPPELVSPPPDKNVSRETFL